ncbi:MAG TPA: hypothetical protein VFX59_10820, partial [Polyangiales bacterium]|nr:hypothetical protein [Polyangiales bacterium]
SSINMTDSGNPRACAQGSQCPYVSCSATAAAFPAPVTLRAETFLPSGEPIDRLTWRLDTKPAGSNVASSPGDVSVFTMKPDLPGDYGWCVVGHTASHDSREACCTAQAPSDFQIQFDPARSSLSIEELELRAGRLSFYFIWNQPTEPVFDRATITSTRPTLRTRSTGGGYGASEGAVSVDIQRFEQGGVLMNGGPQAGDSITLSIPFKPYVVGSERTLQSTIKLASYVDSGSNEEPAIEDIRFNVFAASGGSVAVRFAAGRAVGTNVVFGGWRLFSPVSTSVKDDGKAPDAISGDGWFTGRVEPVTVAILDNGAVVGQSGGPGEYDVLVQGTVSANGVYREGPYRRTTLPLK